jgi:hypothetical protein
VQEYAERAGITDGTGNMELRLRRELAEKRIFPAIDAMPSGTRRDELLMTPDEYRAVGKLRRALGALDSQQKMLPWDVWGAMPAPDETIGEEQYALFDRLAELTRVPDATFPDVTAAYTGDTRLRVPAAVYNAILNRPEPVLGEDRGPTRSSTGDSAQRRLRLL